MMKNGYFCIARFFLLSTALIVNQAFALPPEVESDRLLLSASESLAAKDFFKAVSDLEKVKALGTKLPANFQYHYAKALAGAGRHTSAKAAIENYLNTSGRSAKYYAEALSILNSSEEAISTRQAAYRNCVSELESEYVSLNELERDMNTADRDASWCWDECSKTYCTEIESAPYDRCMSLNDDYNEYKDKFTAAKRINETPNYPETTCSKAHPLDAASE